MAALEDAKRRSPFINNLFCRFSDYLLSQVMQSAACTAFHSIPERAARWLLHAQDRAGDRIELTQEALAGLLGVQRTTVNAVLRSLQDEGLDIVSGGTDNHLMLVDLRPKQAKGKHAEHALDRASITCNKNGIPFDPEKPFVTSGIRLGTPAGTTRGFGEAEFREIGGLIAEVVEGLRKNGEAGDAQVEQSVARRVGDLCQRFPIYPDL